MISVDVEKCVVEKPSQAPCGIPQLVARVRVLVWASSRVLMASPPLRSALGIPSRLAGGAEGAWAPAP